MIGFEETRRALILATASRTLALAGCRGDASSAAVERANPASENCVANGGRLVIETAGDGGQYGVCLFEDNRRCEEWALLRGACPVGGIRITGYVTPAGPLLRDPRRRLRGDQRADGDHARGGQVHPAG